MNSNCEYGNTIQGGSVIDALSSFCQERMLEIKEFTSNQFEGSVFATLKCGSVLICHTTELGHILIEHVEERTRYRYRLCWNAFQWHIQAFD